MVTNRLFTQYTHGRQQALVERLIIEAIKQYGVDVYYIPREYVTKDPVFGEDPLSQFNAAILVEVYPENVEGFDANPAMMSKFGDFMKDEIKFTISKKRFEEVRVEHILDESGWPLVIEGTNTYLHGSTAGMILLEDGSRTVADVTQARPNEGDLIWFPMVERLFEIKYVTMEKMFYPLGKLNVYNITCEIMDYSSEKINTGIAPIDNVETVFSHNILGSGYLTEDGVMILAEDDIEYRLDDVEGLSFNDAFADNEIIERESNTFLDFSEQNPFSQEEGLYTTDGARSGIDVSDAPESGSNITLDDDSILLIED